jgi:lipopolysaccharide transport protein LptA
MLHYILTIGLLAVPVASFLLFPTPSQAELVDDDTDVARDPAATGTPKPATPHGLEQTEDEKAQSAAATNKKDSAAKSNSSKDDSSKDNSAKSAGTPKNKVRSKSGGKAGSGGVVKFWSKSLSGFREQGSLILEQDVVVNQDDIHIEADKATIFFEKGGNAVTEVHAIGAVKFSRVDPDTGQPILAEGQEAVFDNIKRIVTMKGNPVLHRGTDTVRGKAIIYDLTNGWVKADRVEGVVQPDEKKAPQK